MTLERQKNEKREKLLKYYRLAGKFTQCFLEETSGYFKIYSIYFNNMFIKSLKFFEP